MVLAHVATNVRCGCHSQLQQPRARHQEERPAITHGKGPHVTICIDRMRIITLIAVAVDAPSRHHAGESACAY